MTGFRKTVQAPKGLQGRSRPAALSVFDDRSAPPGPGELRKALGRTAALWDRLVAHVEQRHAPIAGQWHYAGARFGWSLRLRQRERVVLYLIPQARRFLVGVVLGDRAVTAAHAAGLPAPVLALIDAAPRYAEGRGFRVPVSTREDLFAVQRLAALKLEV